MAAYVKYEQFMLDLGKGVHQLHAAGHLLKVALTNTAPTVATDALLADITEISAGNGYTAGGEDAQNDYTEASGTGTLIGIDIVWTASGGSIGPFRYAVLYNDTPTTPLNPLIAYWDYGSSITLANTETFTWDFTTSLFTIA